MDKLYALWNARTKIIFCIVAILIINIINNKTILLTSAIVLCTLLMYAWFRGRVKFGNIYSILIFAFMFSFIQCLTLGTHSLYSLKLPLITLTLYAEGLDRGVILFLRMIGSMVAVLLLVRSVKIHEFMQTLRWFRLPGAFIELMTIALKYIFILKDEILTVIKAQKSRLGYKGFYKSLHSMSAVAGIVLLRAFDRSRALAGAMQARGGQVKGNTST